MTRENLPNEKNPEALDNAPGVLTVTERVNFPREEKEAEKASFSGKRVLIVPMSWGRGLGPLVDGIAVAEFLRARGANPAFLCRQRFAEITKDLGLETFPVASPESPKKLTREFDLDFPAFQGMANEDLVRKTIGDELKAIKLFRPDVVFSWLQFTAYISTRIAGIPLSSVGRWTGHPKFTSPLLPGDGHFPISKCTPLFNNLLQENDLPLIKDIWELDFSRSELAIVPGIPELEPELEKDDNINFVGYLAAGGIKKEGISEELNNWLKQKPTVLVYLSAKQFLPEDYLSIVKAAFDKSMFQVIVAAGMEDVAPILPISTQTAKFERLIPIDAIMSKVAAVVSAGTRGMFAQAAMNGVPQIAFPGSDPERDFVAGMVEKARAGIKLTDDQFKPEQLLRATEEVCQSKEIKEATVALGKRLKLFGGPEKAAKLLINLAKKNNNR